MVAGVLIIPVVGHPDIFEATLAHAALSTSLWVPMHAGLVVAVILSLIGLLGLYAGHADRLGRVGAVGFALAVPGLVLAACAFYWEAFLLPVIARHAPETFAWNGPVVGSWAVVASGSLAVLWFIGLALLGLALWRSGLVPAGAALTLAVGAVAFALLAGPFVPVLGPLSVVTFTAGHVWVGAALRAGAAQQATDPRPGRPGSSDEVPRQPG